MNKIIYTDKEKNEIRFSRVAKIEAKMPFIGIGVKYVASGEEIYFANQKKYVVKEGEYILGNDFTSSIVQINQKNPVEGLCIDVSSQIISEVAEFHNFGGTDLREFLLSEQFFVNRYRAANTGLGYTLGEINRCIAAGTIADMLQQNELFYCLAESIVTDQRFVFDHLHKMDFKKVLTNEEVFRSLLLAKEFMDGSFLENLSLEQISLKAGLSKYHFLRLFKNTFGISPYQYVKKKRLTQARIALLNGQTIQEVIYNFGFADPQSFSKAFKQEFGLPPSSISK
jgi:AraC family transcriptional regulator